MSCENDKPIFNLTQSDNILHCREIKAYNIYENFKIDFCTRFKSTLPNYSNSSKHIWVNIT